MSVCNTESWLSSCPPCLRFPRLVRTSSCSQCDQARDCLLGPFTPWQCWLFLKSETQRYSVIVGLPASGHSPAWGLTSQMTYPKPELCVSGVWWLSCDFQGSLRSPSLKTLKPITYLQGEECSSVLEAEKPRCINPRKWILARLALVWSGLLDSVCLLPIFS